MLLLSVFFVIIFFDIIAIPGIKEIIGLWGNIYE